MKRNLSLITELRHGHQDVRLMDWVGPHLVIFDRAHKVAIKIVDLPEWSHRQADSQVPHFLQAFGKLHKEALLYLLEDAPEIHQGQCLPECTFQHLTQLADFLKETI